MDVEARTIPDQVHNTTITPDQVHNTTSQPLVINQVERGSKVNNVKTLVCGLGLD